MNGLLEYTPYIVAMVALVAAFAILFLKKIGLVEYMQIHGTKYVSELFSCDFCMSFWAGVLICLILSCAFNDLRMMFLPILTTPITRFLL